MYSMKEVCKKLDMSYDTLKFYCNAGLIPNVQRDKNNYRIFDERTVAWISSLQCLKKCGMSIKDMKTYLNLCLQGESSIPERKKMLSVQKEMLLKQIEEINQSVDYIDFKQNWYDQVLSGEIEYVSNLIDVKQEKNIN